MAARQHGTAPSLKAERQLGCSPAQLPGYTNCKQHHTAAQLPRGKRSPVPATWVRDPALRLSCTAARLLSCFQLGYAACQLCCSAARLLGCLAAWLLSGSVAGQAWRYRSQLHDATAPTNDDGSTQVRHNNEVAQCPSPQERRLLSSKPLDKKA